MSSADPTDIERVHDAQRLFLAFGRRSRQPLHAEGASWRHINGTRVSRLTVAAWRSRGWIDTSEAGWVSLTPEGERARDERWQAK